MSNTIILGNDTEALQDLLAARSERPETITEAHIVDGTKLSLKWTIEVESGTDPCSRKGSAPVHDDLRKAFRELDYHLAMLCFQPTSEENPMFIEHPDAEEFICLVTCTGLKISGDKNYEEITLFGSRGLPNAKTLELKSPIHRLEGDFFEYEGCKDLKGIVYTAIAECEMYMFDGKHQPNLQGDLFKNQETDQEPKKKRGRKPKAVEGDAPTDGMSLEDEKIDDVF